MGCLGPCSVYPLPPWTFFGGPTMRLHVILGLVDTPAGKKIEYQARSLSSVWQKLLRQACLCRICLMPWMRQFGMRRAGCRADTSRAARQGPAVLCFVKRSVEQTTCVGYRMGSGSSIVKGSCGGVLAQEDHSMWMESLLFHTLPAPVGQFLHNYTMPYIGKPYICPHLLTTCAIIAVSSFKFISCWLLHICCSMCAAS